MKSILLSVLILTASAACAQDIPMPAAPVSPTPIEKVRKIYVGVGLKWGLWVDLATIPDTKERPARRLLKNLRKHLAGTCLEIVDTASEADAELGLDYREPSMNQSGYTSCRSQVLGYEVTTTCTGGGIWTTSTVTPYGGYSLSGPVILEDFVLYDADRSRIGSWFLNTSFLRPSLFHGPPYKDLAESLLSAVGCGSDDRQSDGK